MYYLKRNKISLIKLFLLSFSLILFKFLIFFNIFSINYIEEVIPTAFLLLILLVYSIVYYRVNNRNYVQSIGILFLLSSFILSISNIIILSIIFLISHSKNNDFNVEQAWFIK